MKNKAWLIVGFSIASPPVYAQNPNGQNSDETRNIKESQILVTAEKWDKNIQDMSSSAQVFSAQAIENQKLVDLEDITLRNANVTSTFAGTGFSIRGIGNRGVSTAGTGDLATVYLDNSALSRFAVDRGPVDLWDLAQVEILRGPQSTVQGRNALAGAIILKTADPEMRWSGRARASFAAPANEGRLAAAVTGPIIKDNLSFRVAGEIRKEEGLTFNTTRMEKADEQRSEMIRGKLLFQPSSSDLTVIASYMYDHQRDGTEFSFLDTSRYWSNRKIAGNLETTDDITTNFTTLQVTKNIGSSLKFSSDTSFSNLKVRSIFDGDNLDQNLSGGSLIIDEQRISQELRLGKSSGPIQGMLGAYFLNIKNGQFSADSLTPIDLDDDLGLTAQLVGSGLSQPLAGFVTSQYPNPLSISSRQNLPINLTNFAIFGDGTWKISPNISAVFGFRYDYERQKIQNSNSTILLTELPDPSAYIALDPALAAIVGSVNQLIEGEVAAANSPQIGSRSSNSVFLPKLGLVYKYGENNNVSFVAQRGYRSGGNAVNPARAVAFSYNPEFVMNYEVATRNSWNDGQLVLNANLFYLDWRDQQARINLGSNVFDFEISNIGRSRSYGFELETKVQLSPQISLWGSLGYSNTRFKNSSVEGTADELAGNRFPNAPLWSANLGGEWQSNSGLLLGMNLAHQSSSYSSAFGQTSQDIPQRTLVNAIAGWQHRGVEIAVSARNIFNERYYDLELESEGRRVALLGVPRTLALSLSTAF